MVDVRHANIVAREYDDSGIIGKIGIGFSSQASGGLADFGMGVVGTVKGLLGDDSYTFPTTAQSVASAVRNEEKGVIAGAAMDIIRSTANMAPSIALGKITAAAGFIKAAPVIQSLAFGASAGGNSYLQAINDGKDAGEAFLYGAVSGASEVLLERVLGGIAGFGTSGASKLLETSAGKTVRRRIADLLSQNVSSVSDRLRVQAISAAGRFISNGVSEGIEEFSQELLDPIFRNMIFAEENEVFTEENFKDALYAGTIGFFNSALLNLPNEYMQSGALRNLLRGQATDADINTVLSSPELIRDVERIFSYQFNMTTDEGGFRFSDNDTVNRTFLEMFNRGAAMGTKNADNVRRAAEEAGFSENMAENASAADVVAAIAESINKASDSKTDLAAKEIRKDVKTDKAAEIKNEAAKHVDAIANEQLEEMRQRAQAQRIQDEEYQPIASSRGELARFVDTRIGKEVWVDGEKRTVKGISKGAIQTIKENGTVVTDTLAGGGMTYNKHGFSVTGKNGTVHEFYFGGDVGIKAEKTQAAGNGIFDEKTATKRQPATKEQVDGYIEYSVEYGIQTKENGNKDFPKQRESIDYGTASERLVEDLKNDVDVTGKRHVLRDNDIRHVINSHGEKTNEKYPITASDLKQIPDMVENYDDVLFVPRKDGKSGIYYVKQHNGTTYYLEAIAQNDALIGKQMIKVPTGTIPDIRGLQDAIKKKWSAYSRQMNKIPRMYVQDVSHAAPFFENNSANTDGVLNMTETRLQPSRSSTSEPPHHSDSTAVNNSIRGNNVGNASENVNVLQNQADSAAAKADAKTEIPDGQKAIDNKRDVGYNEVENVKETSAQAVPEKSEQLMTNLDAAVSSILSDSDEAAKLKADNRTAIRIFEHTPEVILRNVSDSKDLPVIINYTKLYLAARKDGAIKGNYHNLGDSVAAILRDTLENPEAIIRLGDNRLNLISEIDNGNKKSLVSVELNSTKDISGKYSDYNVVVTLFSPDEKYINNLLSRDGIAVEYKKEDLPQVNPQLYKRLAIINGKSSFDNSIAQSSENVNTEAPTSETVSKSEQSPAQPQEIIEENTRQTEPDSIEPFESKSGSDAVSDNNNSDKEAKNNALKAAREVIENIKRTAQSPKEALKSLKESGTYAGTDENTIHAVSELAKAFGVRILLFDANGKTDIDGFYDRKSNTIYLNAGNHAKPIQATVRHEMIHFLAQANKGAFEAFRDFVVGRYAETYGKDALNTWLDNKKAEYEAAGMELDENGAKEELCADLAMDMLADPETVKGFAKENRSAARRILDALRRFIDKIRVLLGLEPKYSDGKANALETLAKTDSTVKVTDGKVERSHASFKNDTLPKALNVKDLYAAEKLLYDTLVSDEVRNGNASSDGIRFSGEAETDADIITAKDIDNLRSIGRKSVNDFTSEDIKKAEPFARRYFKELGVKSPFFRAWFGDWRANDESEVKVVSRKSADRGKVKNDDTGWDILVSRQIFKETQHHSSESVKNAVKYLPYIGDVTQNAILLSSEMSGKENRLSAMFHTLYAYTEVMGYPALLRLKVEELIDEKSGESIRRNYILQAIKEEPISESKRFSKAHQSETDSSTISISDLYALVKAFDQDFHAGKPVNPLMLNEDGTPKVFYTGSRSSFTVFDKSKGGKSNSIAQIGHWFTESEDGARSFAVNTWYGDSDEPIVYPVYLDLKNPKVYVTQDASKEIEAETKKIKDMDSEMSLLDSSYYFDEGRRFHSNGVYDWKARIKTNAAEWDAFKAIVLNYDEDSRQYFLSRVPTDLQDRVKHDAEKYKKLIEKQKHIRDKIAELSYSDAYEKFKADVYRQAGQSAEDANFGGIGMALKNANETLKKYVSELKRQGYDGIVIKETSYDADAFGDKNTQYVAFESNQIKSATENIGTFDGSNPDIRYSKSGKKVDKIGSEEYNNRIGKDEEDARGWYDFRRVQEEARREFAKSDKEHKRNTRNDEKLQTLLRGILSRELVNRGINASHANEFLAESKKNGTKFRLFGNVDGNTFHDVFEVARAFTRNGELVDLHEVKSSDDGIGYEDCTNYLSDDGLSGFSITPKGDLISVFNANASKPGFLDAISEFVKQEATTLDCYASPNQNLMEMYKKKFGFKVASVMDYNMEYDHDGIAKNHEMPQVAFMVNTNEDVKTKPFTKDQYAEAVAYRDSFIDKNTDDGSDGHMKTSEKESSDVLFSYEALTAKPDMPLTDIDTDIPRDANGKVIRKDVADLAIQTVRDSGNKKNTDVDSYVHVDDTNSDLKVSIESIRHGLTRKPDLNAIAALNIVGLAKNAVLINELSPREGAVGGNVYLSAGKDSDNNLYFARLVTDKKNLAISEIETVYAINAKKESVAHYRQGYENKIPFAFTDSTISIADLLDFVKNHFSDILPESVLQHYGISRKESAVSNSVMYSLNAEKDSVQTIPKGEDPARDVDIRAFDQRGGKVSEGVRTVAEASVTPDSYVKPLLEDVAKGKYSHEIKTNKGAMARAENVITRDGYQETAERYLKDFEDGRSFGKDDIAVLQTLYAGAAQHMDYLSETDGDVTLAEKLVVAMVQTATNAGQALQAQRLLKKLSPEGTLYAYEKSVNHINRAIERSAGEWDGENNTRVKESGKGFFEKVIDSAQNGYYSPKQAPVEIDPKLKKKLLNAKNPHEMDKVCEEIENDVAKQILSTIPDKLRAWRYMSMLFNPRTHVRNLVGNALFGADGNKIFASGAGSYSDYELDTAEDFDENNAWYSATAGDAFTALTVFDGRVTAFKPQGLYLLYNTKNPFRIKEISKVGTSFGDTVCETESILYYANETGIYAFNGSYPKNISLDRLDMARFTGNDAESGAFGGKYYFRRETDFDDAFKAAGTKPVFVYDSHTGTWSIISFTTNELYYYGATEKALYALDSNGDLWRHEADNRSVVKWYYELPAEYGNTADVKKLMRIQAIFHFRSAGNVTVSAALDNGDYVKCGSLEHTSGRHAVYFPILSGDHVVRRLRFEGTGDVELMVLEQILGTGGIRYGQ